MPRKWTRKPPCGFNAYRITCKTNGKSYVGVTVQPWLKRIAQHFRRALSDSKSAEYQTHISRAIRKYGKDGFLVERIAQAKSLPDLMALEIILIAQHQTLWPNGYNRTLGGEGCLGISRPVSDKQKEDIRRTLTGRKLSEEHKANIASGAKKALQDPQKRHRLLTMHIGRKRPPETKARISAALYALPPRPEEWGRNISNGHRARLISKDPSYLPGALRVKAGKWRAVGRQKGKKVHLGYFGTKEEAHEAWKSFMER